MVLWQPMNAKSDKLKTHLSNVFPLSACDWIFSLSFQPLTMLMLRFSEGYLISKQHLEGAQLEPAFLSSMCAHLCDCQADTKPTKSKSLPC